MLAPVVSDTMILLVGVAQPAVIWELRWRVRFLALRALIYLHVKHLTARMLLPMI
jgi:hypothetical protein